jgi:transposase
MGRPKIKLHTELAEQLAGMMRRCKVAADKERLRAAHLATQGQHSIEEIAVVVGRAKSAVQSWLEKFRRGGIEELLRRGKSPGAPAALDETQVAQLVAELKKGRHRTAVQIQGWIKERLNKELKLGGVYYWLGKLGGVMRSPRPSHVKKDEQAGAEFREQLLQKLHSLPLPAGYPVRIWVLDECRFGLHSFARKVWTLRGHRPVAPSQQKFTWEYVHGALECSQGQAVFSYLPVVTKEACTLFMKQISQSEPGAQHIVLQDGAGFHLRPGDEALPANVQVVMLPAYSPELNPVERLWDVLKDNVCNQAFGNIRSLRQSLTPTLKSYWSDADKVLRLIGRNWLSQTVNDSFRTFIPAFN